MNWEKLFSVISVVGSPPVYLLLFLLFFFFGSSWFFLPLFLMLGFTSVTIYCIKWWFPRKRPKKKRTSLPKKKTLWNHWRFVDRSSFPSAHTAHAAGLFILTVFMGSWLAKIVALLFLVAVGYSRFFLREHYWRDIVAGLVLGIVFGFLAWHLTPFFIPWF